MGAIRSEPVWAGVAIRLADGTLYAFELAGPGLDANIVVRAADEYDVTSMLDDHRRYMASPRRDVDIRVRGLAADWRGFRQQPSTPEEIEPAQKAVEA